MSASQGHRGTGNFGLPESRGLFGKFGAMALCCFAVIDTGDHCEQATLPTTSAPSLKKLLSTETHADDRFLSRSSRVAVLKRFSLLSLPCMLAPNVSAVPPASWLQ